MSIGHICCAILLHILRWLRETLCPSFLQNRLRHQELPPGLRHHFRDRHRLARFTVLRDTLADSPYIGELGSLTAW